VVGCGNGDASCMLDVCSVYSDSSVLVILLNNTNAK